MCATFDDAIDANECTSEGDRWFERMHSCLTPNRGSSGEKRALFLIGDSHAFALAPSMAKAVAGLFVFAYFTMPGGFENDGGYFSDHEAANNPANGDAVITQLLAQNVKPGDVIVT